MAGPCCARGGGLRNHCLSSSRRAASLAAEMPVVPRRLAHVCNGYQHLGRLRCVAAGNAVAFMDPGAGNARLAPPAWKCGWPPSAAYPDQGFVPPNEELVASRPMPLISANETSKRSRKR